METVGLSGLIAYLDEQGHDAVSGQMVDMFSNHPVPTRAPDAEFDFVKNYPLFDAAYQRVPSLRCPYYVTSGGVRRLMGFLENQTKVPLFRAGKGIQLLASSHSVTPCVLSDISCGLLHFKLSGDFANTFRLDAASNNRISLCKSRHLAYAKFFSDQDKDFVDFTNPATRTYDGPKSLVDAGILSSSPAFERFASRGTSNAMSLEVVNDISFSEAGNFLWFRVAKTGTRTVHHLLSEHLSDCAYVDWTSRLEHGPKIHQMLHTRAPFCFTFVRNPFDRLVSAWRNKMKPDRTEKLRFFKQLGAHDRETRLLVHRDFEAFVRMLPESDLLKNVHFAPQSAILSALPEGAFVGRFEHFEEDLMKVMDVLELPVQPKDIPRRNSTNPGIHCAAYYTPQLVEIVESLYSEDLAKFGYHFERES